MKIIQLLPELNAGGVERGTLELGRFLAVEGHESMVVSAGGRLVRQLEEEGSRHVALPVHRKHPATLLQVGTVRRLIESERPDIIHVRSRVPAWVAWLAWRRMDPATRPRLVSTVHGFNSVNRYSRIMTCGERVIAVSEAIREFVLASYPGTDPGAIRVIPRGVDPGDYHPGFTPPAEWVDRWQKEFPQLEGKTVLLLPGRITRLKGHQDFFEIVRTLAGRGLPVHGLVVGGAHPKKQAYLQEVEDRCARMGLEDKVTFAGHRTDLREIISQCAIIFSLTQQPESFGRTTLEALALGVPVVGYRHGGVGEQLAGLFPAGAAEPLSIRDAAERTVHVLQSGERPGPVGPPYTLESMCRSTVDTYRELTDSRTVRTR